MPTYVFLSSTAKDLVEYRKAVCEAIEGLEGYHCVRMENFGARAYEAADFCRKKVGDCQLFVGIVGHLYGSSPRESEQSYTELEYEAACDYEKPRLMFVAPKDFNVPAHLIDEELEREPEARRKQKAFRERALADRVAATTFYTPQELAGLVTQAIHNWERDSVEEQAPPNVGPLVPQTCDRVDQEADFRRSFALGLRLRPGFPQFYVVHGEERESHQSLVERLRLTIVQKYATFKWGEQQAAVPLWDLDWPEPDDPASRREQLKSFVFERVDPLCAFKEENDYSAVSLRKLLASSLNPMIVLHHKISTRTWDGDDALIRWYLSFWDEVKADAAIPQFVVFLSVVYPHVAQDGLAALWRKLKRQSDKRRVQAELRAVCETAERKADAASKHCPCVMLDELRCVRPEEVMTWFTRHRIGDHDMERERRCQEIFREPDGEQSECRNMRDVESKLGEIHRQIISGRARA